MNVPPAIRLNRYLTVIVRWLLVALVVFILTILGGFYITDHLFPKVYTATAQIQLRPRPVSSVVSPSPDGMPNGSIHPAIFQAQFTIMRSSDVLLPIIRDLGLDKAWAKRVFKPKQDQLSDQDALAYMNKILKLDFVRGTNIINITVSSGVPTEAAEIANAVADRYKILRDVEEEMRNNRGEGRQLQESPVRIISRALPPEAPSKPNRLFDYFATILVAGFLSVMTASFVEIIFLLLRASERTDN